MATFGEALRIMGVGFGSVFFVLALFFGIIKALMVLLPAKQDKEE